MDFKLACGHTRTIGPRENFLRVIREGCMACLMGAVEAEAVKTAREAELDRRAAAFFGDGPTEWEVIPATKEVE